jgi:uncharacterized protein (TIGR03663 family)
MQSYQVLSHEENTSPLDRLAIRSISINWEAVIFFSILVLAFASRFYDLGLRVMSHDETSHVYFSWRLYQGYGYQHDPVTHGPLQFHLIALSYFLFGDNDFSARIPAALFSIATIAFMWNYRRYLGRIGALIAATLFLISPYMLYYGRYARNEAFVALFGVMMIWSILRYLEDGKPKYLFWLIAATALHFTAKETAFIYTAQALIFLGFYFIFRVTGSPWPRPNNKQYFFFALVVGVLLVGASAGFTFLNQGKGLISPQETASPSVPGQSIATTPTGTTLSLPLMLMILALLVFLIAVFLLLRGYTLPLLRTERSFDLLIVLGTMILPMLAPFPVKLLGWDPTDYTFQGMLHTGMFLLPLALLAIVIGLWWNPRLWLLNAGLFYGIFTVFYTTIFTNGSGFFTGMVGSLGYWLAQQGVQRGSQPWYYYILIQIPIYEYLPALGSLLAFYWAIRPKINPKLSSAESIEDPEESSLPTTSQELSGVPLFVTLTGFWLITSVIAFTYAGEKMPWLTVHIALPMILLAAWALGRLIESINWTAFREKQGFLILVLIPVFLLSIASTLGSLLGNQPPFQGKELFQLQATSTFITALLTAVVSGWGLFYLLKSWAFNQASHLLILVAFGVLGILTARTAIMASYINYNLATEFLVYAHTGPGPKEIMSQVEEISRRTTDGLALSVAYDDITQYPFWWYLRNYPNQRFYGKNPTLDLREIPIILVGQGNYDKIEPVVRNDFYQFDYIRMWWPMQDYFNLTFSRVWNAISNPAWRSAIFQIWFNRNYKPYSQLTNVDLSLPNWSPSDHMRMYLRKDVAAKIWNYGVGPAPEEVVTDPYMDKGIQVNADIILGTAGTEPGEFMRPRGLVVAPDGSLYVADTENNRIEHLDRDGNPIKVWGSFGGDDPNAAPPGTFNEPWGIALGPDGSVYVADVWNHRIQKFTADGQFITMWGSLGRGETPFALWGPRDVVLDSRGQVIVSDTGNKRIVIYDSDGNYLSQFGEEGLEPGQFNEPVGLAVDSQDRLYVADTWNQRIQVFSMNANGEYTPLTSWEVFAWYGQSLDNKPYLAVDGMEHLYATDPDGYRVLEFTSQGEFLRYWGDFGQTADTFGLAGAVTVDPSGGVWVSDTGNSRIMHFTLPPLP